MGEFVGEEEQSCLIAKSSVFINYLNGWAELKSNTYSGVGEENKNCRLQLPACIEASEDFTKVRPEGLLLFPIYCENMSVKRDPLLLDLPLLSGTGDSLL